MRRVGQARKGPMLLKLYGPKPGPARRTQARGTARPDVLRPEARPCPRGLRARAGLGPGLRPLIFPEFLVIFTQFGPLLKAKLLNS